MASQAIQALARPAQSARNTLANMRETARIQEERIVMLAEVAVGGGVAGFVDGYWTKPQLFGMPAVPIVGVLLAIVGTSEWVPAGTHIAALGAGMVSGSLYEIAARKGAERAAA